MAFLDTGLTEEGVRVLRSLPDAEVLIGSRPDGQCEVRVKAKSRSLPISRKQVLTKYPDKLILQILEAKGPSHVCDEIAREEDPQYVCADLKVDLFSFVRAERFAGLRILDFGCGAGASTMVLHRLLPETEIYGIELDNKLLQVARARACHYGLPAERLMLAPDSRTFPEGMGTFDAVILSAVWEHLLPAERPAVIAQIWRVLRPGGYLFVSQTPHRFSPVENHTTGLPLINYLTDELTLAAARRWCRRVQRDESWESLLRRGIRGGTEGEVLRSIRRHCNGTAVLMDPLNENGIRDRVDLWFKNSARARLPLLKRCMWAGLKCVKFVTGQQVVPSLTLAIRKQG
jgi:SAM-dependent methyltransferase